LGNLIPEDYKFVDVTCTLWSLCLEKSKSLFFNNMFIAYSHLLLNKLLQNVKAKFQTLINQPTQSIMGIGHVIKTWL